MSVTLTPAQLAALRPCADYSHLFGDREQMDARQALEAGASVDDLLWVAGRLGMARECVRFALLCAERVAHMNPDPRVRAALDAAQAWLDDPSVATSDAAHIASLGALRASQGGVVTATGVRAGESAAFAAYLVAFAACRADRFAVAMDAIGVADHSAYAAGHDAERAAQLAIFLEVFG